jgi:hypothetical protein
MIALLFRGGPSLIALTDDRHDLLARELGRVPWFSFCTQAAASFFLPRW